MSVDKYSKHQRSRLPKFLLTDPKNGKVLATGNNEKEFEVARRKWLESERVRRNRE